MNYGRFYSLFRQLPKYGDDESLRQQLVASASAGRTTSLRELSLQEYEQLCRSLEKEVGDHDELRKMRSVTLRLMQQIGVDTTDWLIIDAYCRQARIAGKLFRKITIEEHRLLQRKLRAIQTKQSYEQKKNDVSDCRREKSYKNSSEGYAYNRPDILLS